MKEEQRKTAAITGKQSQLITQKSEIKAFFPAEMVPPLAAWGQRHLRKKR